MITYPEGPSRADVYKRVPIPGTKDFLEWFNGKEPSLEIAEKTLNAAFGGKEFDSYRAGWQVSGMAGDLLRGAPSHEDPRGKQIYSNRISPSEVALTYRGRQIAQIYYKKKKGKTHHAWWGSHCDWTYDKIIIQQWPESVKAALDQIDQLEIEANLRKKSEKEKNLDLLSKILPLIPGSYYDKFWKLEELVKMRYDSEAKERFENQ